MRAMFSTIAPRYDFITRVFSYGMDGRWKKLGVSRADLPKDALVLDLACGSGRYARLLALNEVFVGHRTHQSARYRVARGEGEERQLEFFAPIMHGASYGEEAIRLSDEYRSAA